MIILDTNVISEISRPNPSIRVIDFITGLAPTDRYITAITEAELHYGVQILPPGEAREIVLYRIERTLRKYFAGRVLPFDSPAARFYARISAERRAAGRPISQADCQIAAIAYSVAAPLATRNVRDFEECGIEVIDPWSAS